MLKIVTRFPIWQQLSTDGDDDVCSDAMSKSVDEEDKDDDVSIMSDSMSVE